MRFVKSISKSLFVSSTLTVLAFAVVVLPSSSEAAAVRGATFEEKAIQKATNAMVESELEYTTKTSSNLCGTTGQEGVEVKVMMKAGNGKLVILRTYGVTYAGVFSRPQTVLCK